MNEFLKKAISDSLQEISELTNDELQRILKDHATGDVAKAIMSLNPFEANELEYTTFVDLELFTDVGPKSAYKFEKEVYLINMDSDKIESIGLPNFSNAQKYSIRDFEIEYIAHILTFEANQEYAFNMVENFLIAA